MRAILAPLIPRPSLVGYGMAALRAVVAVWLNRGGSRKGVWGFATLLGYSSDICIIIWSGQRSVL